MPLPFYIFENFNGRKTAQCKTKHWQLQFHFNEIKFLSTSTHLAFCQISGSTNDMVDALAKQGIDRVCALAASLI